MEWTMKQTTGWMILRFIIVIIATFALAWALGKIFSYTYPFWIAAFFAWMLMPLTKWLHYKLRLPNGIAALVGLLLTLSIIGGIITGLIFLSIELFNVIAEKGPAWMESTFLQMQNFYNENILPFWERATGAASGIGGQSSVDQGIAQLGSQLGSGLGSVAQTTADALTQLILGIPTLLIVLLFIVLAIYFIGKDWNRYAGKMKLALPPFVIERLKAFYQAMWARVFGYIRAQLILMLVTGVIVLIGLLIMRVEGAYWLAAVVGVAEFLPYLGTGTILIPWGVYLLITGNFGLGLGLLILYTITMIVRQIIEPKVLSSSMNLNPLAVLISLFAGLQMFGAVGLLAGPAILVLFIILWDIGVAKDISRFIRYGFDK